MALDQATTVLLGQMAQSGAPPLSEMSPQQAREMVSAMKDLFGVGPDVAQISDMTVPVGDAQSIAVRVYMPQVEQVQAAIIYYHGGGWVVGAIDEYDVLARQLAQRTGSLVCLVDYRLAPEHRYPTAAEDAWAALLWTAAHIENLELDVPLVVMGDSAGGNLAAVTALRATAEGGPTISAQVLAYPVTDSDFDTESYLEAANQLVLDRDAMIWFWDHYAPDVSVRTNPDASPLRATDLSGLPPAIVLTAEHDPLRDEGEAYALRLRQAGVPVSHERFVGQMHGFFTMPNVLPGAAAGMDFIVEHLHPHLALAPRVESVSTTHDRGDRNE